MSDAATTLRGPYLAWDTPSRWLRGNHHGHSTLSDGNETPHQLLAAYQQAGYDYLALSEHDLFADPADYESDTDLCLLPAVEVSSVDGQTLMHLGPHHPLPARQLTAAQILQAAHDAGGLFVFDHPNWQPRPNYATDDLLTSLTDLAGMEIYCGVIERLPGQALATDRWDRLLSLGRTVWGHATDDQHDPSDRFIAWNCVQWQPDDEITAEGIIRALAEGRFVASTGVSVQRAGIVDSTIRIESDADEIHWIVNDGIIASKQSGGTGQITAEEVRRAVPENTATPYVRAECYGRGAACAWTQPFRLS